MTHLIKFQCDPGNYRHWRLEIDGEIATLLMDVDEQGGLFAGYQLKLNSYDLGVDIELADIVQRLRFEHPEVGAVILRSGKDNVFCAGANIKMLGGADHAHKVNFCKFTNETRNTFELAGVQSGQYYICAIQGACAGGGYELALACDHIILADDGASNVALPEVPLLAVLPGTGGLTRVTDKRKVRRDLADVFCTTEEGIKGQRAADWSLVDEAVTKSKLEDIAHQRATEYAARTPRPPDLNGISLTPLEREINADGSLSYSAVQVTLDRPAGTATIEISAPNAPAPASGAELQDRGADNWLLRCARELDDAILHLRFNELACGVLIFKATGDPQQVAAHEAFLLANQNHWLAREILLYWRRVLQRIDITSRSLVALIEPGSCFAGLLAEILFAVDRSYMADGAFENDPRAEATLTLSAVNFGALPMANDLTRLQTRFIGAPEQIEKLTAKTSTALSAQDAYQLGLVTFALDDIDWDDEVRVFLEERASFSPDALTGMEANLRFAGVETMQTRIFGRLTAWQNWIFQRPNAVGEDGALQRYGTGLRAAFDKRRV